MQYPGGPPIIGMGLMQTPVIVNPSSTHQATQMVAQKAASLGPKTSLTEGCPMHPGQMILFKKDDSSWCDKCYAETERTIKDQMREQPNKKMEGEALPMSDLIAQLQAPAKKTSPPPEEDFAEDKPLSQHDQALHLQNSIMTLIQSLQMKIEKKQEGLILNYSHFGIYENTLNEKFNPVFQQLRQIIKDKRLEYTTYLNRQLSHNDERICNEKVSLEKLSKCLLDVSENFRIELEE